MMPVRQLLPWFFLIIILSQFERCRSVQSSAETRAADLEATADQLEKVLQDSPEKPLIIRNIRSAASDLRAAGKKNETLEKKTERSAEAKGFQSATKWIVSGAGIILVAGLIAFLFFRSKN